MKCKCKDCGHVFNHKDRLHRLLCGDATDSGSVARVMGGVKASMLLCDPPYGVQLDSKNEFLNKIDKGNRVQTPIEGDDIADYRAFFTAFLRSAVLDTYNTAFVFMQGKHFCDLCLAFDDAGYYRSCELVWAKNNHVLGRQDYNHQHELILYGWRGKHKFYGQSPTTLLQYDRPSVSELHPTMKPLPLLRQLIEDGSPPGGIVYDGFLGSGSTMVAAEQSGRSCYGLEISPAYTAVVLERMSEMGLTPRLGDG